MPAAFMPCASLKPSLTIARAVARYRNVRQRLDRYTRGNLKAQNGGGALFSLLSIVPVPTEDEERQRAFTRQRGQIVRERQRLQSMGRSPLASYGIYVKGNHPA